MMHGQSICCGGQKGFLRCRGASAEVPRCLFAAQPHEQRQMGSGRRDGDKGAQPAPRVHPPGSEHSGVPGSPHKAQRQQKAGLCQPVWTHFCLDLLISTSPSWCRRQGGGGEVRDKLVLARSTEPARVHF